MNPIYRLSLLIAVLAVIIGMPAVTAQETAPSSVDPANANLPDAPSTTQSTTCTEPTGKPCPEWVHKLIGQYPPFPESGTVQPQRDPSSVHFWTYRGWQERPLRTNKQVFHSKLFIGAHVGGAIAMIVACRNRNSREEWHSEVPAVAAMFGMDYLQFRFVGGPNAVAPAVYEMVRYGRASTR